MFGAHLKGTAKIWFKDSKIEAVASTTALPIASLDLWPIPVAYKNEKFNAQPLAALSNLGL
jgi:hypothetical protein